MIYESGVAGRSARFIAEKEGKELPLRAIKSFRQTSRMTAGSLFPNYDLLKEGGESEDLRSTPLLEEHRGLSLLEEAPEGAKKEKRLL